MDYRDITCIPFASRETLLGLIITVSSTLEIVKYLVEELGYEYVLTSKLNQDCLEVVLIYLFIYLFNLAIQLAEYDLEKYIFYRNSLELFAPLEDKKTTLQSRILFNCFDY